MTVVPLTSGIDSLYWSCAPGVSDERFSRFLAAREHAAEQPTVIEHDGFSLVVESHGSGMYPVLLTGAEFSVQLTDSERIPTAFVQLRAEFIHEVGPERAYAASRAVVEVILERGAGPARASRLDVYGDFGGWTLSDVDRRGIVTKAKLFPVLRAGTDEYETVRVGVSPMVLRLYRKDIEVRARGGFADRFWDGYGGPVVRVEAQAGGAKLRELGIATVEDALASYGLLWSFATTRFCVLCEPDEGPRSSWRVSGKWMAVWALGAFRFPQSELVPVVKAEREQERVARQLLGSLASYAAFESVFDGETAVERLRARYPRYVVGERDSFAAKVVRRYSRLSRAVREGIV